MKPVFKHAWVALALALAVVAMPAGAQDAVPTSLDADDLPEGWKGAFTLSMEFQGRQVEMVLNVSEVDGMAGAVISNDFQGATTIEEIEKTDDGLKFTYPATFGGNQLNMALELTLSDGEVKGTLSEASGLFSADIAGKAGAEEGDGDRRRGRGRRGAPTDTTARYGKQKVTISFSGLSAEGDDYGKLEALEPGNVFGFVGGRATKMFTDVDMTFGDTVVKTENIAEDYPGVYGLWLKKVEDGWHLVFNEQPDIWGTQHDPKADVAEVPLTYAKAEEPASSFGYELETTDTGGILNIAWGNHTWAAPYTIDPAIIAAANTADKGSVADLVGQWRLEVDSQFGELHYVLTVNPDETYSMVSDAGEEVELSDLEVIYDEVTFNTKVQNFGVKFKGTFTEHNLGGNFEFNGSPVAEVRGVREEPAAAE